MLSLAVSFAFLQAAASKLDDAVLAPVWNKIQPSIVIVLKGDTARGTAALIDSQGYFLTGKSVVSGAQTFQGQFYDGQKVTLFVVTVDGPTQLALLRTYDTITAKHSVPLFHSTNELIDRAHPKMLIAAVGDGPITAQLVSTSTLAVVGNSREVAALSEIHFDGRPGRVAGSPVFALDGSLVGVLQATLTREPNLLEGDNYPGAGRFESFNAAPLMPKNVDSVLYSPGPATMQRVVSGFLTPKHAVLRPAIGVFCKDAPGTGALVDAVEDGSPADLAGLKEGDVIIAIDGDQIRRAFDFSRTMFRETVGSDIAITAKRHGRITNFRVRVGMP
jgi:putative serine protease PepD